VQFEPWRSQVSASVSAHWDPLVWDGIAQYYPWRLFAAQSLRSGVIPLWNPYQFCGTPFLANGQSAVLYLLNLLFWLLPVARAFGWSAWLHLIITGWFAYLFLRRISAGRLGALAGAIVWQTNGFFVAWIHLPTVLCTATWLPLILLLCERALTTGRARYALAAGVMLAFSYLGGHPQIFLFVALLTAAYLLARAVGRAFPRPPLVRLASSLKLAAVTAAFALGLSAAQLIPTLDLLRIAHRAFVPGPDSYAAFLSRALPGHMFSNFLLPHPVGHPALGTYLGPGNYAEYCCYVGIVGFAFALWAGFAARTWHARFFASAALLAILVALGTPLNWPLYHYLPGMASAGGPARVLLLAVFSFSMLAGLGMDTLGRPALSKAEGSWPPAPAVRSWSTAILLLAGAAAAFLGWFFAALSRTLEPTMAQAVVAEARRAVLLVVAAIVLICAFRVAALRQLAKVGLLVVLAADLLLAARHHVHVAPLKWIYPGEVVPAAEGRVLSNAADWPIDRFPISVLPPNGATVYRLRDVFGYDSLYLARYRDFAAALQHGDPSPPLNGNLLLPRLGPVYGLDMMSLAAVQTVLSPVPLQGLEIERVGAFYTYRNPYARPRAWVADSAVFRPTHQEAFAALLKLGPREDCLIITGPDLPAEDLPVGLAPNAIVRDLSPNSVAVDLPQGGGYLFLADSYAPGWRAHADRRELPVRVADVTFRAVAPPRQAKSVVFRYEPASFRVGLFITLLALGSACAGGGWMLAARGMRG